MYQDIYNCICQKKIKKIRFIIHYVKPTAQLLFRIRFPKGGPTCRRQVVNDLDNDLAPSRRQAIIITNDGKFNDAYMRHSASMS